MYTQWIIGTSAGLVVGAIFGTIVALMTTKNYYKGDRK